MTMMKSHESQLPDEYADLTLGEIRRLYAGPGALPCPPELVPWLEVAQKCAEVDELARQNRELRAGRPRETRVSIAELLPAEYASWSIEDVLQHVASGQKLDPRLMKFLDAAAELVRWDDERKAAARVAREPSRGRSRSAS